MNWFKKIANDIRESEDFSEIKSSKVRDVLNGNILTKNFIQKQYPLLLLIAFLGIFYIGNRYEYEARVRKENRLRAELRDTRYESLSISAELMQLSRRSNVLRMVNERGLGLVESTEPPIRIE
ncbi:MAG: hypothetical protein LBE36_06620 [Flavobacteriaceae bacterium]|jgi:hypothetical protein|nr:hypothetical protein [Flavobacteriaceae bacterium]